MSLQLVTILTDQSNISKILIIPQTSKGKSTILLKVIVVIVQRTFLYSVLVVALSVVEHAALSEVEHAAA